jgi:hypothetical protein
MRRPAMKEAIGSHEGATTIRTRVLELIDAEGNVCLRLQAGQDGPTLAIVADPDVCRGELSASLRVLTGGSYNDDSQPIAGRVQDLEDIMDVFGATIQAWRGGTILPPDMPGWERREVILDAEETLRGDAL